MRDLILRELKEHTPFTVLGALSGVVLMFFCYRLPYDTAYNVFYTLHPVHIVLSAFATASMYRNYKCAVDRRDCNPFALLAIGFVGSIGIATVSDSLIPYLGEVLLHMPHAEPHVGFIEKWYLVLPLAGVGTAIAYYKPMTEFSHTGHVLISTWASLFHIIMASGSAISLWLAAPIFLFLFLAVWVPCCVSDIIFPLLFVGKKE